MAITVQGPTGVFQPSYPDIIDKYGVVTKMFTSSFKEYFTSNGSGGATDTYWPYVSMLLHGDGTNAAQNNTFFDTSTNNFTVTRNGNTTQGSFNPFVKTYPYSVATNGGSGYFAGLSTTSLTVPKASAFVLGTNNFTIEFWVYYITAPNSQYLTGDYDGTSNFTYYIFTNSSGAIQSTWRDFASGTNKNATSTNGAITTNTWYHIAFVRDGNTNRQYINGVQNGTVDVTGLIASTNSAALAVGQIGSIPVAPYFNGYISNFRLVNGTCLYPSGTTFTPPTAPLTAVTNTALLLGMSNGAIYDNTMLNNLETVANAQISTSVFKYGTGSMKFNGTTDYLTTSPANQAAFAFGSGDFTIEMWVNPGSTPSIRQYLYGATNGDGPYPGLYIDSTRAIVYYTNFTVKITGSVLAIGTWVHIALCRSGTSTKLFVDGVQSGVTFSDSLVYLNDVYGQPTIGCVGSLYLPYCFNGYIDDLRVTKGIARYTTTFTPPTAAFPNLGPTYPSGTATQRAIFGYGTTGAYVSVTNIVSNTGVVAGDTTGVGTARAGLAAASYGGDKALFGYGTNGTSFAMTNLVSNTGVVAADTTGVGTARIGLGAAGYGTDKAIFGYGGTPPTVLSMTNLVSNTGVVSGDTAGVGTARAYIAATGYGTDKAIFVCGTSSFAINGGVSLTNLVSNTGVVATDTTIVGTGKEQIAAARYGGDKAIYGYGVISTGASVSTTNLISNTGVVSADVTGVGTARRGPAASNYGGDKAIFGYGLVDPSTYVSITNLVSNTGVVATDTTGVGTARYFPAAAGFSYS